MKISYLEPLRRGWDRVVEILRYESRDTRLFDQIIGKFDKEADKLHGLVHRQTVDLDCMCPACLTRR